MITEGGLPHFPRHSVARRQRAGVPKFRMGLSPCLNDAVSNNAMASSGTPRSHGARASNESMVICCGARASAACAPCVCGTTTITEGLGALDRAGAGEFLGAALAAAGAGATAEAATGAALTAGGWLVSPGFGASAEDIGSAAAAGGAATETGAAAATAAAEMAAAAAGAAATGVVPFCAPTADCAAVRRAVAAASWKRASWTPMAAARDCSVSCDAFLTRCTSTCLVASSGMFRTVCSKTSTLIGAAGGAPATGAAAAGAAAVGAATVGAAAAGAAGLDTF